MQPARFRYKPISPASEAEMTANVVAARSLGLPDVSSLAPKGRLAIVGGGPSINHRVHALRNWKGDIWAINGAALWCEQHKIRHALFTCDPTDFAVRQLNGWKGAAILALCCHPLMFAAADVSKTVTFDASNAGMRRHIQAIADRFGSLAMTTTLTNSAVIGGILGLAIGYDQVTYFGCECSYSRAGSHAYQDERARVPGEISVTCNGKTFLSRLDYLVQAIELSNMMKQLPALKQRCGGLTGTLAESSDNAAVIVDDKLKAA